MKPIKKFDEFIESGVVKKQSPNRSRAEFLIKESGRSYSLLLKQIDKMEVNEENANNYLKDCYDILMEVIRAKMLIEGFNASGFGAHEAEVSYLRILGFKEIDVQFIDQMRFFRNGIVYYGTALHKEYAEKVIEFTKNIYARLRKLIHNDLGD